ncbi:signal peptidase I [Arcanobacterium hippocoleae]
MIAEQDSDNQSGSAERKTHDNVTADAPSTVSPDMTDDFPGSAADSLPRSAVRQLLLRLGIKVAVAVGIIAALFTWVFGVVFVQGEAMFPGVRDGDIALFYRLSGNPVVGDVVVYDVRNSRLIGRVAAMGGDSVDFSDRGELIVNGAAQQEAIYLPTNPVPGGVETPYQVPEGCYFILGDNRPFTTDSRLIGAVCEESVRGNVINLFRRRGI